MEHVNILEVRRQHRPKKGDESVGPNFAVVDDELEAQT
jgi:hypothetical protein